VATPENQPTQEADGSGARDGAHEETQPSRAEPGRQDVAHHPAGAGAHGHAHAEIARRASHSWAATP